MPIIESGGASGNQKTLYIFLEAHLTNSTSSSSRTFSIIAHVGGNNLLVKPEGEVPP
jgi:hypothetical protein